VVRNVTGCPLAGITHDEIIDASPLAQEMAHALVANPEFYNLPRKFKISATGCAAWCSYPEINDLAFTAVRRGDKVGYTVRVGGGLSSEPHLAVALDAFIRPEQALDAARAITQIFRDQQGLRESRDRARIKYLFMKEGWTAESFLAEVERRLGYVLEPGADEVLPRDVMRDHVGIHRQKQPGLSYVGASVLRGRLSGDQLAAAAELAERFGDGQLRTSIMQNLLFINIPTHKTAELARELGEIGLRVEGSPFWRGAIACTGTEFCKLAISETKSFTRWLVEELEGRLPGFDQDLKLHVTGCPNSCGQHWIADIGLEGKKIKHEGRMVDAFYFCVGGGVGQHAAIARPVGYRIPATEVPSALERLLTSYLDERIPGEDLQSWFSRYNAEEIRARLAGEVVDPVERDVAAMALDGD
jgi:sulfite reductase (ferredoxin)